MNADRLNAIINNEIETAPVSPTGELLLASRNLITMASQASRHLAKPMWLEQAINDTNRAVNAVWSDLEDAGDIPTAGGN